MSVERWQQIQDIFDRAADLPPDTQKTAVEEWGDGDPALIADVLKLLEADAREHPLLDNGLKSAADSVMQFEPLTSLIQKRIGPYRLLKMIGEGGMGVVYLAERTDIGSLVAIKLLRDAWFSPLLRERFAAEQRILAQLNHPGIARIYDSGSLEDGTPWFVMEYVDGTPLTEYCADHCRTIEQCLRLFRDVCEAVQYAHEHAVIHRDLKPSNILVTSEGEVKLLDFGIAKSLDTDLKDEDRTVAALRMMTPAYCAPEQLAGGPLGVYTDGYALGVLLYELLAGQLPSPRSFKEPIGGRPAEDRVFERPSKVVRRKAGEARVGTNRPEQGKSGFNNPVLSKADWADLDAICLHSLRLKPSGRYRSVGALTRDLDAFFDGRPLEARPDSLTYTTGKFIRRNRASLTVIALVLLIASAAAVYFTVHLARARNTAIAEAARTQRIQDFMLHLFGDEDKEAGPSNEMKVVSLLDRGIQQARSLNADSETQAKLYQTLGSMYNRLGQYQKSDDLMTLALQRMMQATGPDSAQTAWVMVQLGTLRGDEGKLDDSRHYIEQALSMPSLNRLPANDRVLIGAKVAEARLLVQTGSYAKAIEILKPISQIIPPYPEDQAYNVRDSLTTLTSAALGAQQLDLAKSASQQAIAMDRQLLGESHPQTGVDLLNLASVTGTMGELPEAEAGYRNGIAIMTAWYAPDNPDVTTAKSMLAKFSQQRRKMSRQKRS